MSIEGLNNASKYCLKKAEDQGFYDENFNIHKGLMHAMSEIVEAGDAIRHNKQTDFDKFEESKEKLSVRLTPEEAFRESFQLWVKDTVDSELTDALQILLGICAHRNIDIEKHLTLKNAFNELR